MGPLLYTRPHFFSQFAFHGYDTSQQVMLILQAHDNQKVIYTYTCILSYHNLTGLSGLAIRIKTQLN